MEVKFKRLHKDAKLPKQAYKGDAGLDLTATSRKFLNNDGEEVDWCLATNVEYGCGLAVEIPEGYVGLLFPRSSVYKTGQLMSNCVGVIDAGYRGEIKAVFRDMANNKDLLYKVGERFAQLIILPIPNIEPVLASELSKSERGEGGYGSSGK